MKQYYIIIFTLLLLSCGKDKSVLLPEIENAKVTEVLDVSPAYIFYNEAQPDSVELNRKNLISTTNWLFNIDKRLTLEQVIPKIKFLQDKKRNAEIHKNENAKNYFTCNDTSIQNLGFIEFTDTYYDILDLEKEYSDIQKLQSKEFYRNRRGYHVKWELSIFIKENGGVFFYDISGVIIKTSNIKNLLEEIHSFIDSAEFEGLDLKFCFDKKTIFQNYISIKSELSNINSEFISINKNEFIY